jgi:hypothetical protein
MTTWFQFKIHDVTIILFKHCLSGQIFIRTLHKTNLIAFAWIYEQTRQLKNKRMIASIYYRSHMQLNVVTRPLLLGVLIFCHDILSIRYFPISRGITQGLDNSDSFYHTCPWHFSRSRYMSLFFRYLRCYALNMRSSKIQWTYWLVLRYHRY